jgi:hypothetical protein
VRRARERPRDDLGAFLERDPILSALAAEQRAALGAVWEQRAGSELRVSGLFAVIARELLETGAAPPVLRLAARAVSDEVTHAEIARRVAAQLLDRDVPWPSAAPVEIPVYEGVAAAHLPALHVVGMCCINETIASAFLEASLAKTRAPLLRRSLRTLLRDEVDHARLGWAHLASRWVDATARAVIGPWLAPMVRAQVDVYLRVPPPQGLVEYGVLPAEDERDAVLGAVRDLVAPGLAAAGFDVRPVLEVVTSHRDVVR